MMNNTSGTDRRQDNGPGDAVDNGQRANGEIDPDANAETVPKQELDLVAILERSPVVRSPKVPVSLIDVMYELSQFASDRAETSAHNQIAGVNEEINPPPNNVEQQPMNIELKPQPLLVVEPKTDGLPNISSEVQSKPAMDHRTPQGSGIEITPPTSPAINDHDDTTDGEEDAPADHPVVVYPTTVLSITEILQQTPLSSDDPIRIVPTPLCVFMDDLRPSNKKNGSDEESQAAEEDAQHDSKLDAVDPAVQELAASFTNKLTLSLEEKTEDDKKDGAEKPEEDGKKDGAVELKDGKKDGAIKLEDGNAEEAEKLKGDEEPGEDEEQEKKPNGSACSDDDFNFDVFLDSIPEMNATGIKRLDVSTYDKLKEIEDSDCPNFELLITEALAILTEEKATKSNIFEFIISNHLFSISIKKAYGYFIEAMKRMIIERRIILVKKEDGQHFFQLKKLNPPKAPVVHASKHVKYDRHAQSNTTSTSSTHYLGDFSRSKVIVCRTMRVFRGSQQVLRGGSHGGGPCARQQEQSSDDAGLEADLANLAISDKNQARQRSPTNHPFKKMEPKPKRWCKATTATVNSSTSPFIDFVRAAVFETDKGDGAQVQDMMNFIMVTYEFKTEAEIAERVNTCLNDLVKAGEIRAISETSYSFIQD